MTTEQLAADPTLIPPTEEDLREAFDCGPPEPGTSDSDVEFDIYEVETKNTGTWRWGVIKQTIFHRISDKTYWAMSRRVASGDGDNPDEPATIFRVYPYQKTITCYSAKPQEAAP